MPGGRPPIDLEARRAWITERVAAGITQKEIRRELEEHNGLKVGRSKLMQQLAKWNITARRPAYKDSEELRECVAHCFHVLRLTDNRTQEVLEKKGYHIGAKRIARLRKEMGLLKRIPAGERDDAEAVIARLLHQELKDGNNIRELGRKQLYKHIRSKYNVIGR
ncbi:hypothetical protein DOTSEDRAFT_30684 [Dothistroma septosporum NZE10]|uniref:Clr5 domain-containing protein n=1 Tax=Dothistroma septosporum (strain NZE10 / CBS 128990) TaxID=675120 RepID=N1Q2H6_DOTSN|nr:hypothetical protein DOTSEDRAFT_30684 [Dothistroma septosporum NZE10]